VRAARDAAPAAQTPRALTPESRRTDRHLNAMSRAGRPPSDVAFSDSVKAVQARLGSRKAYARLETGDGWETTISPDLAAFIGEQRSFFMATASAAGQPYIQHRGGPKGFLRVLDGSTLAFADCSLKVGEQEIARARSVWASAN